MFFQKQEKKTVPTSHRTAIQPSSMVILNIFILEINSNFKTENEAFEYALQLSLKESEKK